jgi:hypothetical protein
VKRSFAAILVIALMAIVVGPRVLRAQRPRLSPRATVHAQIDGATITIEYGRPYMRGRTIWGSLVPWNHWWMPGADEASSITTDQSIVFADTLAMPAGEHTIYTQPGPDDFKLIISKETGQFHTQYHPNLDLGRVSMTVKKLSEPVEQLTFGVEPREGGGGTFKLVWDDREYSVPFVVKKHP